MSYGDDKLQETLARLRGEFIEDARARVKRIEDMAAQLDTQGPDQKDLLEQLRMTAHSIKGAAGNYGFGALSNAARDIEFWARDTSEHQAHSTESNKLMTALKQALNDISEP